MKTRAVASFVHPSSAFTLLTTGTKEMLRSVGELNEENAGVDFSSKVA